MKLDAKRRNKLKSETFGLPSERKYPMPDRVHAINAKARARQEYDRGRLSGSQYRSIVRKADGVIARKK